MRVENGGQRHPRIAKLLRFWGFCVACGAIGIWVVSSGRFLNVPVDIVLLRNSDVASACRGIKRGVFFVVGAV